MNVMSPSMSPAGLSGPMHWELDKHINLATVATLLAQIIAVIWFASSITFRVGTLEDKITAIAPQADRITRLEVKLESIKGGLDRIETALTSISIKTVPTVDVTPPQKTPVIAPPPSHKRK